MRKTHRQRCDQEGRDWSDAGTSKEGPRPGASGGSMALPTPGFPTSGLQTVREQVSVVGSRTVCGALLRLPQNAHTLLHVFPLVLAGVNVSCPRQGHQRLHLRVVTRPLFQDVPAPWSHLPFLWVCCPSASSLDSHLSLRSPRAPSQWACPPLPCPEKVPAPGSVLGAVLSPHCLCSGSCGP